MKKNICLLSLTFLFAFFTNSYCAEQTYDGSQYSVENGDTLVFDGQSPYNDIANNINSTASLTGAIYITGQIDSYQQIFGNNLLISSAGKITVDLTQGASSVLFMSSKTVVNDGVFTIVGDGSSFKDNISDVAFKGGGQLVLNDSSLNMTNTVSIEQSTLTITDGKLTSDADLLNIKYIENHDTLSLLGGKLIGEVSGSGLINVNSSSSSATVFANSVLGNDIALRFGALRLGSYEVGSGTVSYGQIGSASERKNFTMHSGTVLDMANGRAGDTVYADNFTVNGPVKVNADFDLAAGSSDKININAFGGPGSMDLSGLNIVSDFSSAGHSADIALFEGAASVNIASIDTLYYKYLLNEGVLQVSGSYKITNSADNLGLNFTLLGYEIDPFQAAVKAYGERMIRVESVYNIPQSYDNIVSTGIFTVIGGVDGAAVAGSTENPKSLFVLQDASSVLKLQNITLKNGFNDNYAGAVFNEAGEVILTGVTFDANGVNATTASADAFAYGGAVYNFSSLSVSDSQFKNNSANALVRESFVSLAAGGAVYISSSSDVVFENVVFEKNTAQAGGSPLNNHYAYGGAVYIDSDCAKTVNIVNSVFKENSAVAALALPDANEALAYGGAVYNGAGNILNVKNSSFTGNRVDANEYGKARGGAIYNAGELNLIADGGDVEFDKQGSAVFNSSHVFLNAAAGNKIIFREGEIIDGENGSLHVNKAVAGLPYGGDIELHSVYGNDIFLYAGTLKVGGQIGNNETRNDFTISSGAVLDMINGKGDSVLYFKDFYMPDEDAVVKIDLDLAAADGRKYDRIDIGGSAFGNGKFDLSQLKIVNEFTQGYSLDAQILVNSSTDTITDYLAGVDFLLYRYHSEISSSVYHIKHNGQYGTLNVTLTGYSPDAFQAAISTDSARSVQLDGDYFAVGGFSPVLGDGKLTVNASTSVTINANQVSNVFKLDSASQSLELNGAHIINGMSELGGAVYNSGQAVINGSAFSNNVAASTLSLADVGGGAIYNDSVITVYDSVFKDNRAEGAGSGGAIYNDGGIVNLVARGADLVFSGNSAGGVSNAFHAKDGAVYNLNAGTFSVIINDGITSYGDGNVINVNLSTETFPTYGKVIINADMSGYGNDSGTQNAVNVYGGSVKLGENAKFFTNVGFNMYAGATLDMTNSKVDNIALDGFSFIGDANLAIDADLRNKKTDSLLGSKLVAGSSGRLLIKNIVIWKDLVNLSEVVYAPFADDEDLLGALELSDGVKKTFGPVFLYNVSLNGGSLVFEYAHDYNPSVFIAPVTMLTGGYLGQINSYRRAFETVDDSYEKEEKGGIWVKPYIFSEDIELNGRLTVSNEGSGAYFGYDGKTTEIYSYTMNFSIYGAYSALRQTYEGAEINQGGGMLGVTAVLYADKFFAALTANMGIISEHGQGTTSKDNFMMYTKGVALKSGYNLFFSNDIWQLQPSLSFSMSSVDMAPYTNSADVKVVGKKFSPFNIEPSVKLISNAFENFKLYADLTYVIGLSNETEFSANDVTLPEFSIEPYLQYSVGGYKDVLQNFTAGGEIFGRSGGRSGFGGQLVLKLKL
jgi:hypothetical protein